MNQKQVISIIIGIIVVAAISTASYFYRNDFDDANTTQWVSSGPFAISKTEYKLGENIFITAHGIKPNEVGKIIFLTPHDIAYKIIPFNGTLKSDFNNYFKPNTNAPLKILKPEELVGTWEVKFQGVPYSSIRFEIINEYVPGAEEEIVPLRPD